MTTPAEGDEIIQPEIRRILIVSLRSISMLMKVVSLLSISYLVLIARAFMDV